MAENIRSIKDILTEIFYGKDSAIEKCARVRHTYYEIGLWQKHGIPLSEIDSRAKVYFEKRFLGQNAYEVSQEKINKAYAALGHAEKSCIKRCQKLVEELNKALTEYNFNTVKPKYFIDWLTFAYFVKKDAYGKPIMEPGFNFETRIFTDPENRKLFKSELKSLLQEERIMDMKDIAKIASFKRKYAVKIE